MSELKTSKPHWMKRSWIWVAAGVLILMSAVYAGFRHFEAPSFNRYAPALAAIVGHNIDVDSQGRVNLAKQFPGLTDRNDAYVTWRDDGSCCAMFPTYYGRGTEIAGLMYTSRPLIDADLHASPLTDNRQLVTVGSYQYLRLEERLNPSWYRVSYKLK